MTTLRGSPGPVRPLGAESEAGEGREWNSHAAEDKNPSCPWSLAGSGLKPWGFPWQRGIFVMLMRTLTASPRFRRGGWPLDREPQAYRDGSADPA